MSTENVQHQIVETPKYNLDGIVGLVYEVKPIAWNTRDLLLYAVGIGAGRDDLSLVYENHPKFQVFPTYPCVLSLKGTKTDVFPFQDPVGRVPGLPRFDTRSILHVGESMNFVKPIPKNPGPGWTLTKRVSGVNEKANGKGFLIDIELTVADPQGEVYSREFASVFYVKSKVNGVPFAKSIPGSGPLSRTGSVPKDKVPDFVETFQTSESQALLYRLSGDYNPHCVDPALGVKAGLKGATLQGLGTWGISARLLVKAAASGEPSALKAFGGRFSSPVEPGDALKVNAWATGVILKDGSKEYVFETLNLTTGKAAITNGVAHLAVDEKTKL